MSIPNNDLDDVNYEQLVSDGIRKISSYTTKWTNYNPSDPGITFIELFAFLAEIQIYRLNRISNENYKKYLKLLGIKQNKATPAKIDITIKADACCNPFYLDSKSKFILQNNYNNNNNSSNDLVDDLYLETLDGIWVIPSLKIDKIFTYTNGESSLLSSIDPYIFIFGDQQKKEYNHFILGLTLQAKEELASSCEEITLFFYFYEGDLPPHGRHGSERIQDFLDETFLSKVKWEYAEIKKEDNGYRIVWKDLRIKEDTTNRFTNNGKISFPFSENQLTKVDIFSEIEDSNVENRSKNNDKTSFIWIRCTLIEDNYTISPRVMSILPNTVSAELGSSIAGEYLVNTSSILIDNNNRASNGLPNQTFEIKNKKHLPILRLYDLYVSEERWEEIDDFDNSYENDKHYVIDRIGGFVKFGDGKNGLIPSKGSEIKIDYMYGQVNNSNIPPNSHFTFISNNINENNNCNKNKYNDYYFYAYNTFAPYGGSSFETLKEALLRLRNEMKEPFKIVSSDDCENIVKSTPGLRISQVKAIPSHENKNTIDVIVAPFILTNSFNNKPMPKQSFLTAIKKHLDKHRLITTFINVYAPSYVDLSLRLILVLSFNYSENTIKEKIHNELYKFFSIHPSKNSPGWNFGQNVYKSDLYTILNSLDEIDCVRDIQIEATGDPGSFEYTENDVIIGQKYLVILKDISISTINPM